MLTSHQGGHFRLLALLQYVMAPQVLNDALADARETAREAILRGFDQRVAELETRIPGARGGRSLGRFRYGHGGNRSFGIAGGCSRKRVAGTVRGARGSGPDRAYKTVRAGSESPAVRPYSRGRDPAASVGGSENRTS